MVSFWLQSLSGIRFLHMFCVLCCVMGYSQTTKDTIVASMYVGKAEEWMAQKKTDSALKYYHKALPEFAKTDQLKRVADCYAAIAESHLDAYDFDIAFLYAQTSLAIQLWLFGDKHLKVADSYTDLGHIAKAKDQYQNAMEYYEKALDIRRNVLGGNHHDVGNSYRHIGTIHHLLAQYDKALDYYAKALPLQQQAYDIIHPNIADTYIDFGTTYYHLGKYDMALSYYQKALKIRITVFGKNSPEVGVCYNHIGNILTRLERFDNAMESHKKAMSILHKTYPKEHPDLARCYVGIGVIYRTKGKHDLALEYLNKAFLLLVNKYKLSVNSRIVSTVYNQIGYVNFKKGLYDKSLYYYQKSLNIKLKIYPKRHSYIGANYNNIGYSFYKKGEYDKALMYYKKSIYNYVYSLGEKHNAVARTYNNIANVYKRKRKYSIALEYYQKALTIRIEKKGSDYSEISASYFDVADVYVVQKEYSIALEYYRKALQIYKGLYGEDNYYVADIYNRIANLYQEQKESALALQYLYKSMDIRLQTDGKYHPRTAKSYNQLAKVYTSLEKFSKAVSYYDQAISANVKVGEILKTDQFDVEQYMDTNLLLHSLNHKARVLQQQYVNDGDIAYLEGSIALYQKADKVIHAIREELHTHEDKITFATQIQEVYSGAIQSKLWQYQVGQQLQHLYDAFYYAEKSKANTLKGLLTESNAKSFVGLPKNILETEQELKAERAVRTSELIQQRSKTTPDTVKINIYENLLFDIARKQDSLTRVIEQKYPKYYKLKHQDYKISVTDIQKQLDEHVTLLEYFYADDRIDVFVITKEDFNVTSLSVPNLIQSIERFRHAINSKHTKHFKDIGFQLYDALIAPVRDYVKGDQLIIVPDGPLWHLNFELICSQKEISNNPREFSYMLREYAISYANSVKLLMAPIHTKPNIKKSQECLAFSFSDMDHVGANSISLATLRHSKEDLPGTRKEIKAIADIIEGKYYFGSQAIEHNFKKNAADYNVLHLALHGEVDHEHPQNSRLLFTKNKDSVEDNYLYSHELFAMNIPAELTVLSACNTGTGKIAKGEGIMSLGNAFQYAGTKSLVLSSWEVSDFTTPELMKYFYTNLKKGMSKSKALQQAKLKYVETAHVTRVNPFYWGSFYLVGDPAPIPFDTGNYMLYWILGILVIVFLLGWVWYRRRKKY